MDEHSFQIDKFKSTFKLGGARPNLFRVTVDFTATDFSRNLAEDKITFTCRAAQIPGMTLGTIEVPYFGRKVKVAGDRTFAEWTITILNDEDFVVRRALERWHNRINLHADNVREAAVYNIAGGSEYKKDASVIHFDKKGEQIAQYTMAGAYPSDISAIDLAWDTNDTIEEYTCTFQYDYFTNAGEAASLAKIK